MLEGEYAYRHSISLHGKFVILALLLMLAGCTPIPGSCPGSVPYGLLDADAVNMDASLPFRFPLEYSIEDETIQTGWFASSNAYRRNTSNGDLRYHTGEDYFRAPGTPVYAIADGIVRHSGPTLQHGWLITIDHPGANLYSLYAHLAVSGWHIEPGAITRGALIGYVGDPSEYSTGSKSSPVPRLHFGIRTGQWVNYPGLGDWRGEGLWVRRCPQDLGWLHPSITISSQIIPAGGFSEPGAGFFAMWWLDLLVSSAFILAGGALFLLSRKWGRPILLIFAALLMFAAGTLFYATGSVLYNVFLFATVILVTMTIEKFVLRKQKKESA